MASGLNIGLYSGGSPCNIVASVAIEHLSYYIYVIIRINIIHSQSAGLLVLMSFT